VEIIPHAPYSALLPVRLRDALRLLTTSTLAQHLSFPFVDLPKKHKKKSGQREASPVSLVFVLTLFFLGFYR
jgi:hypothetical protein